MGLGLVECCLLCKGQLSSFYGMHPTGKAIHVQLKSAGEWSCCEQVIGIGHYGDGLLIESIVPFLGVLQVRSPMHHLVAVGQKRVGVCPQGSINCDTQHWEVAVGVSLVYAAIALPQYLPSHPWNRCSH